MPVNPRTTAQGLARARMAANSSAWRGITSAQRAGWGDLGAAMSRNDSLGQSYTLNGFGAYTSVNQNREFQGLASLADAPALSTPATVLTATITLSGVAFSVAYTPTPMPAGTMLGIFASPQRSAGRAFENDTRFIMMTAAAAASPANVLAAYTAKFGVPVTGNRIFLVLISYYLGFASGAFVTSQVVA